MFRVLHTNDLHGQLREEHVGKLLDLRTPECLFLDSGDAIKAGNLAIPLRPEVAWDRLAAAHCDLGTLGNRETHVQAAPFRAKLAGAKHPLLVANLRMKDPSEALDLPIESHRILEVGGIRIGVFGVMVPMVTERMTTAALSRYLWDDPIKSAHHMVDTLHHMVDLVIAITHIGLKRDLELAKCCPGIPLIFGGHSHSILSQPEQVGATLIFQGGSHARYVGCYDFDGTDLVQAELVPLTAPSPRG